MLHEHYIPSLDDKTQRAPNQSSEVSEAHDLSLHCGVWHLDAWSLVNDSNQVPAEKYVKYYKLLSAPSKIKLKQV